MIDLGKLHFTIKYYEKEDITIAVCPKLLLFEYCEGNNYSKASKDLQVTVNEYYGDLKDDKENLGNLPISDLEYLNGIFGKIYERVKENGKTTN